MSNDFIQFNKDGTATVSRTSPFSGEVNLMTMELSPTQFKAWHEDKELIQNVMPHLSLSEREFLKTGITDEEYPKE